MNLGQETLVVRYFKGDRWIRKHGSPVPIGAKVEVIRNYPKRKVLVRWNGREIMTMLWCLSKEKVI